ncbi:MAG: type IV pilus assembly protein PilB [Rhodothermales bacterium]|jgi:type IV pilus assembly protein PilB
MRLGLFDFKRNRDKHSDADPDAVFVDVADAQGADLEEDVTPADLAELWDSLAAELDQMSLDDLDEQLSESPRADADVREWAESEDADALRSLVDSFVVEESRGRIVTETASPEAPLSELDEPERAELGSASEEEFDDFDFDASSAAAFQDEAVEELSGADEFYATADTDFDPDSFDEAGFMTQLEAMGSGGPTDATVAAAELLSGMRKGGETPDELDEQNVDSSGSVAKDILQDFHAEEAPLAPTAASMPGTAGVVSDEVILALMHEGVIRVAQVYEASRHRRLGEPLWRAMLDVDEVDRGPLLAEVARQSDYKVFENDGGLPVRNLVRNMRETLPTEAINAILLARGIPVEIGIDAETFQYRLVLATDDPASADIGRAAAALPVDVDLRYMPTADVDKYLDEAYPERPARTKRPLPERQAPANKLGVDPELRLDRPVTPGEDSRATNRPWPAKAGEEATEEPEAEVVAAAAPVEVPGVEQDIELLDRRARKDRVISALFKEGSISIEHVEKALTKYGQEGGKEAIWRILATVAGVDRDLIFAKAAKVYAFPRVEIDDAHPDHEFVMLIMETIAEERREDLLRLSLLPYEYDIDPDTGGARLIFVTHDPAGSEVHRLLAQLKVGRFELRYAPESELLRVITEVFPKRNEYLDRMSADDEPAFDYGAEFQTETSDLVDESALEAEMSRSVLLNLFEASLIEAVRQGASDLHIYPNPKRHIEIHFRVDGRLRKWHSDEKIAAEAYLAVVKDNSTNVDRFERDAAQDGFIQRRIDDGLIRFRVSVLPIASANQEIRAESVVIRVLDDRKVLTDLSKLGMLESAMEQVQLAISQPHGMVILTGPTGSGKSTTLVAALHQVISPEVNVLTIEDPVEYIINGVRQIKLSHKLGLEDAIRAVLRHDPDIVMVGEMRDKATADLAIKLANTGHLTFSTLHTNDAPSAISRLYKMGVEPFLLAYAINLIVAQRLIRQLCPTCKRPAKNRDKVMMERLGFNSDEVDNLVIMEAAKDKSCPTCSGSGYKGRRAISETLYFSQAIRHIVAESGEDIDEDAILKQAVKEGMLTLQDCARQVVCEGGTTMEEMMRVTATE